MPLVALVKSLWATCLLSAAINHESVDAINGGTSQLRPHGGWKVLEVISEGDVDDNINSNYALPRDFDGLGAWLVTDDTIRFLVNHETTDDATISEIDIYLTQLQAAIQQMMRMNIDIPSSLGIDFVKSARQAFSSFSDDMGENWINTNQPGDVRLTTFCSGQSYLPNTFGPNRGFVDAVYMVGEEDDGGRLMVLDSQYRQLYQLSGVVGHASWGSGNGGMPFDSFENAALIDTGEENHIALMLSSDGGTESLYLYIGLKGMTRHCQPVTSIIRPNFLERNGLACGRWWYLIGSLPDGVGSIRPGTFSGNSANRISAAHMEDVDTSPSDPTKVALAVQEEGVYIFDFDLKFSSDGTGERGIFNDRASSFTVKKIAAHCGSCSNVLGYGDNVEWTDATTLGGVRYPNGLLYVNEDHDNGEVIQMTPDGSNQQRVATVITEDESTGTFDISSLVGYRPASILIVSTMGSPSSLSLLVSPNATLASANPSSSYPTSSMNFPPPRSMPYPRPTAIPRIDQIDVIQVSSNSGPTSKPTPLSAYTWWLLPKTTNLSPEQEHPTPEPTLDPTMRPSGESSRRVLVGTTDFSKDESKDSQEDSTGNKKDDAVITIKMVSTVVLIVSLMAFLVAGMWG